ncbi:hypothetical protein [Paracoccus beibuensis]|uniref:hypothetical protein n=1 Tax=Paracoccus beibuensis TaxID=547602 RepID=UPI002240BAC7|nr:hypothetical protein [Paracoccus beibuensis]
MTDPDDINETAAAFIERKLKLLAEGQLRLSEPMSVDEFEAMFEEAIAAAKDRHARE